MEQHLVVILACLRDASELYRQLEGASRQQTAEPNRARDLAALAAEYSDDLELIRRQDRNLRSQTHCLEDELQQLEAKLQDRRTRRTTDAATVMALAEEIASLQKRRAMMEQALLELWQQGEDAAGALAAEQEAAATAQKRLDLEREDLSMRCGRANQAVPEITSELSHLLRQLPRRVAAKLEQMSRRYADPVADLWQGACGSCGQNLPAQEAVDAEREAALVVCQGCGRFIVARSSRRTRS